MVTSGLAIEFEHPLPNKVTELSKNCLALTAGNALAFTELFTNVGYETNNNRTTSVEQFVEVVKRQYQRLRQKQIVERILMPRGFDSLEAFYIAQSRGLGEATAYPIVGEIDRYNYGLDILLGGISPGGAHLYVVDDPGTSDCLDSIGFHAIGSGTNLALSSLIANQCCQQLSIDEAVLVALRAKKIAENAPGVGERTDISILLATGNGPHMHHFKDAEISKLRQFLDSHEPNPAARRDTILLTVASRTNPAGR